MKVAILGVGLIGGSIGLAARRRAGASVRGYDSDPAACAAALALGAIDEQASELAAAVEGAEVVFVAAPVGAVPELVHRALELTGDSCVISDVGSTKGAIAQASRDQRFVGGHPLAGAETAGVVNAREDLFDGATWYLTPAAETSGVLYERLHRLLASLGAQPTAIEADAHDRLMACVSHLPHVLANALVAQASSVLDPQAPLPATGPSFRDATRVAGANTAIWTDIYLSNRDALIDGIEQTAERLREFGGMLRAADAEGVAAWNERARVEREALLGAGAAGGAVYELRTSVPNRPGVIAQIALGLGRAGVNIVDMALSPSADNRQGSVALWVRGEEDARRAQELVAELGLPVVRA